MSKEGGFEIIPTKNQCVIDAYLTCPMTIPVIVRERYREYAFITNYQLVGEKLSDKRIAGVMCMYRFRKGFIGNRCVFSGQVENCPLTDKNSLFFAKKGSEIVNK